MYGWANSLVEFCALLEPPPRPAQGHIVWLLRLLDNSTPVCLFVCSLVERSIKTSVRYSSSRSGHRAEHIPQSVGF